MYLRTTKRRNQDGSLVEYYQLAETRWDPAKRRPTAHIIHNFGRADTLDRAALLRLARSISRVCHDGLEVPDAVAPPGEAIDLEWARPLGVIHVARALWEELGIGGVLRSCARHWRRRAPHELALFAMVANRLCEPLSKLACHDHWLPERVYFPEAEALTLDHLYFALDFLDTHIEAVEREIFFRTADLFRADVDLIFWDTTSVYFEIDEEDADEATRRGKTLVPLRKRGHSKEGHDGNPQVVVGLALTRDGLPVRSWVFPGHTVDATTVAQVKESLRGWQLGHAIFVGDAGMDSEANRHELAKGLGHYILAMPMGRLTEIQQEVLSRPGRFRLVNDQLEVKEVVVGDGARQRRYIVCRNREEAERQHQHRQELLAGLRQELDRLDPQAPEHTKRACELVASKRYGRYLARGPGGRLAINAAAVRRAERMDGKYVLLTNDETLTPEDVGLGYKAMMIIEACFRRMKTTGLRIRPVYHWTAHRIVSHVKLCVLALLLERAAEIRAGDSWRNIRFVLEGLKAVRYRVQATTIVQTTRLTPQAAALLKKLQVPPPQRLLSVER
jgi:Transposase DDE domain